MATARAAVFRAGKTSKKGKRPNVAAINVVKRGKVSQVSAPIFLGGSSRPNSDLEQTPVEMQDSEQLDRGTPCTTHASRKLKMYERWERLRDSVLHAVVEGKTIAPNSTCCCCHYAAAEGTFFCKFDLPPTVITVPGHQCDTGVSRKVMCFHLDGPPKMLDVLFCSCVPDAVKLVQLHYWPGTPQQPSTAFSFELLDWIEALFLECQVALQDVSAAFQFLMEDKVMNKSLLKRIYPGIIDSFEEYRFMKNSVRSIDWMLPRGKRNLLTCPACPKESGKLVLSIDALFGLCRKKVAGSSVHPPLNSGLLFEDVGDFIEKYHTSSSSPATNVEKECHNFLAGNHLRSRSRYKALDETGVMGVACRHEFPIVFINLRHGERIGYAVYLMKKLKERYSNHQINLLYDVACSLKGHLQSTGQDELLSFFSLALPIFHCYGHKASCQVKFSPRFAKGYGLTDGEVMERLWSQMRRFSRMTKEMRPSHRIDVLTDAFIYCATKAAANLAKLLPKRMKHAKEVLCRCEQQLNDLIKNSPTSFHMEDVQQWILQEQKTLSCENENSCTNRWEEDYLNLLKAFTTLRECMEQSPNSETSAVLATKLTQMEIKLQQMEQTNGIVQRWQPSSLSYKCAEQRLNCKQQQLIKQKFEACARERWFLLSMKAKYAEGHALACRLARRITTVSSQLKELIKKYNLLSSSTDDENHMTWETATDLSTWHNARGIYQTHPTIPTAIKKEACQAAITMERAREEVVMLKEEMSNTVLHYIQEHKHLSSAIESFNTPPDSVLNQFDKGTLALLHKARCKTENHLSKLSSSLDIEDALCQQVPRVCYQSMNELTDDNDDFETELSIRETATECQEEDDDDYEEDEEEDTDNINADGNVLSQLEMHITSQTAAAQQQHIQQSRALNSILEDDESVLGKTNTAPACPLPILSTPFLTPLAVSDISTKSHNQLLQRRSHEEVFDKNSNGAMENETMDWTIEKFIQQQPSSSVHCEEMVQHFEESSDDDEAIKNETMEWRRNRLEREEFIQQQESRAPCSVLTAGDMSVLSKIVSPSETAHRFSYLELLQNRLTSMLAVANRSAQRLKEMDMLKKGPHFVRTNKNH